MKKKLLLVALLCAATIPVADTIDLSNLDDYQGLTAPTYISKDNTGTNPISNEAATLGRVLFYDLNLSSDNTIACASCHRQSFAFSQNRQTSQGVNGETGRHSTRLINSRFADEIRFFWDERAATLEDQTTMPIQDHKEMGFSGTLGDPDFNDLLVKLDEIDYYNDLFNAAFGDTAITEARMQIAMAQFVRSIQSFDSKYDFGRALVIDELDVFPNFSPDENAGKDLFMTSASFVLDTLTVPVSGGSTSLDSVAYRVSGGFGCNQCHRAPEFDIDPASLNNSLTSVIGGGSDFTVTRSPSLRDLFGIGGGENGPFFHAGVSGGIDAIVDQYNLVVDLDIKSNVDPRLIPMGKAQFLNMTEIEIDQLEVFLKTLTGIDVYTNRIWSDPFNLDGSLSLVGQPKVVLKLKANLGGAWASGEMRTDLNSESLLPLTSPYSNVPMNSVDSDYFTNNPDVVDWVWVELRRSISASDTVTGVAALIDKNGVIHTPDETDSIVIEGVGNSEYHVVVGHRNHLSVMSLNPKSLSSIESSELDLTLSSTAYGLAPSVEVSSGVYALWPGDGNEDESVTAFDYLNTWLPVNGSIGYFSGDFNLDGDVSAFDFLNAWLLSNGLSSQVPQ